MPAPKEERAIQALKTVQALTGAELQARIDQEVGTPMLGVLDSLAKAVFPGAKPEEHHRTVHLMVLSYLMHGEVEKKK
ncbi:MAG TPA: hypothetical protein VGK67_12470 [Myxococcales bacterium]